MATLTSQLIVRLVDQVTGPARAVGRSLLGISKAADGAAGTFGARLGNAIARNNRALDQTRGQLVDAVAGFYVLKNAISAPIKSAIDFESALADIAKVSNLNTEELDTYGKRLRKLAATEIPMAVNDLAALSAAAAQAGVPDDDLFDFTRLVAKAAVAWEMSGAEAGEALAKIRTALGLTNEQTAAYADAINYVSDSTAASAPDLIDFSKRVAAQGEFYGFAKEQTLAFGAAMISAGAESEVAATSFRNMGRALTKGASATKAQRGAYKALGLDARKVAKAMQKDAVGTTIKVIEKLGQLPEHMQASVMSDLFGDEARALAPLLNDVDQLRKALALTADEQKYLNSVGKEFEKRSATSAYKLQRFKSQLNDIALVVGGALLPALNKIIGPLGEIALKFSDWAEAHPELIRNVIAATGALIGFKVALIGLRFIGLLGRGGALSMLALGFNTVGRAAIGASNAIRNAVGLQRALGAMDGKTLTGFQTFTTALGAMVRAVPGVSAIGTALSAIGGALATISAPAWLAIGAAVAVVAGAGALLWKYWDRVSSVASGIAKRIGEELSPAIEKVRPLFEALKPVVSAIGDAFAYVGEKIGEFFDWIGSFFEREVLNDEQKDQWEMAGYDAATRMIEAIKSVFSGLIEWASGLGSQFASALTNAAVGAINRVRGMLPTWAGGVDAPSAPPANDNAAPPATSGHRATGGPAWAGSSYLVGEKGPEIFTPKSSGTVTPAGKMGGQVSVVNHFAISGVNDPDEVARRASRMVIDDLNRLMRGSHADMSAR